MTDMDENRTGYDLKALGRSGASPSLRLPGCEPFPPLDEHLVEPEVTRDEIIGGRRVVAMPALEPHAGQQSDLDYVLRAHVAPGYKTAADLLTRHDYDADFASDACIYGQGADPETGGRRLEEVVFEIVSEKRGKKRGEERRETGRPGGRDCRIHPQGPGSARHRRRRGAAAGDSRLSRPDPAGPLAGAGRPRLLRRGDHVRAG